MKDTPFHRQDVSQMTFQQVSTLVEQLRERRLAQQRLYEEVRAAKSKIKEQRDLERYKKILVMLDKKAASINKAMDLVEKYIAECQVLRLEFGDNPWQIK